MHRPVRRGEHAEDERDGGAEPGPQAREGDDRRDPGSKRDRGGERVLVEVDAWLAVDERVVERVHQRERGCGSEDERLPAPVTDAAHSGILVYAETGAAALVSGAASSSERPR